MQIFDVIDSTQLEAKRQIDVSGFLNDSILAFKQTTGLTTKIGVPWVAQKGDLLLSVVFNIEELNKHGHIIINYLSFCVSIAMFDFLKSVEPNLKIFFKWPNDVLILQQKTNNYKKICGILADVYKGHFIIGIGCNLVSFPEQTNNFPATSLFNETGKQLDCIDTANQIIKETTRNIIKIQQFGFNSIKNKWKEHAYMMGQKLCMKDGGSIIFNDINDEGFLVGLNADGKKVIITSDEVICKCKI